MQLDNIKFHAHELVHIIPDSVLAELAADTKTDYYSKVLTGERMFHLLLYAFCMTDRISQRRTETMFNSA
ncbi:MAG: IS4/IS5 family transposase, partial [Bacteroidales bacterium]|nr:IS4/IS5 family transposase [Bacteroidales bacterium]